MTAQPPALERLEAAADLLLQYPFACWHYGDSIGFEGLLAASALLRTPRYEGFVYGAIKAWIPRAKPYRELDNTAPGHAICLCYEQTHDPAILDAAGQLAEFIVSRPRRRGAFVSFARAPLREPYGNVVLSPGEQALLEEPGPGVFVDCLHFDAPFLVHLGTITANPALVDTGAHQALAMIDLLQDQTGLFWHFWLEKTDARYGYAWGRGQGWALLGLLDVLQYLPHPHSARAPIIESTQRLVRALVDHQDPSGHWPALVDDPDSYLETSTALFVATGLLQGMQLGIFGTSEEASLQRAWDAGAANVTDTGKVSGVSVAVWASTARAHYSSVPTGPVVPWGQGPYLTAAERIRTRYGAERLAAH